MCPLPHRRLILDTLTEKSVDFLQGERIMGFPDFMLRGQMCPQEIVSYTAGMEESVIAFLTQAFEESGKQFEIEGRHKIYSDIPGNFELFLCMQDGGKIIGTVALHRLNGTDCELKTMYLLKDYQGKKLGYRLAVSAIDFARTRGFTRMYLDSMKQYERALRLYHSLGFKETSRYNDNDKADVFMVLDLN